MAQRQRRGTTPAAAGGRGLLFVVVLLLFGTACPKEAGKTVSRKEPGVRATVLTIQTTTGPDKKSYRHELAIANGVARSLDEIDVWHLYDTKTGAVTTVDEIAGTHRTRTAAEIAAERRKQPASPVRLDAKISRTESGAVLLGVQTIEWVITAGEYRRELLVGRPAGVPPKLFSMLYETRLAESTAAGATPAVDAALLALEGFPMIDRASLPYGESSMTVERAVTKVEQRDVPQSWFAIPQKSRDTSPAAKAGR